MKILIAFLLLGLTSLFAGCSHVTIDRYHASADNVQKIKDLNTKFNVSTFTATKTDLGIHCRLAGPMSMSEGESFEKYIENAFIEELKMAGMYSKTASVSIKGHLNDIDASSGISDAHWTISLTVSSNSKSFTVTHKRDYKSSFSGATACQDNMPKAFAPTVKELIGKVLNNPKFKSLITN